MSLTGISAHVLFTKTSLLLLWFTLLAWKLAEILIRCFLLFARDLELQLHRSAGLFLLKLQEIYHLCSVPFYLTYVRILTHLNKYFSCSNRPCSCRDTLNRGQFLTGYICHLFVLAVPVTVLRSSYCFIPSWLAVFFIFLFLLKSAVRCKRSSICFSNLWSNLLLKQTHHRVYR